MIRLALIGPSRCGKDTAGEWLRDHTVLKFEGGCSWAARHYMAGRLSAERGEPVAPEQAYAERHKDRPKWYRYLNEFRSEDPARLIRLVLQTSDFVCGIRDRSEYEAAVQEGLIDLAVWIERPGLAPDPTLNITASDCDISVLNDADLAIYLRRWKALARALKLMPGL